jgi:orotate phosphoribosyltransferase
VTERERLAEIIRGRSFRRGEFTLASGQKSDHYFNLKPTLLDFDGAGLCGNLMADLVKSFSQPIYPEGRIWVSGLAVGAVPLIGAMCACDRVAIQGTFVRKQVKDHGTKEAIEGLAPGESLDGVPVVLIEDVCTTGGSFLEAAAVLRAAGAVITGAGTLVERGGRDTLKAAGIDLHHVFHADHFLRDQ